MKFLSAILYFLFLISVFSFNTLAEPTNHHPLQTRNISYEDIPKLIIENNENLEAAKLYIQGQKERTGRLVRSFYPKITGQLGYENYKLNDESTNLKDFWKVEASLNLYNGNRDKIEDSLQDEYLNLKQLEYSIEHQSALKEAKMSYWQVVALNQLIASKNLALEKNKSYLSSSKKRVGAGIATNADLVQFELQKISLEKDLIKLKLERDLFLNSLSVLFALEEHENIQIVGDFPKILTIKEIPTVFDPNDYLENKLQKSYETIDTLKVKQTANWWLPKLDLYSTYSLPNPHEDFSASQDNSKEWFTGIRLSLDLGQEIETHYEAKALSIEALARVKKNSSHHRQLRALDHELKHDLKIFSELIETSDQEVKLALDFLKLTESEYARGVKNGPDLLESFKKYLEALDLKISYHRDYYLTKEKIQSLASKDEK